MRSRIHPLIRRGPALTLIALALLAITVFAGCTWTGKGKDVAKAMAITSSFKSRAFTGAIDVKASEPNEAAQSMRITFTGVSDNSDPTNPKLQMTMTAEGQSTAIALPGDGNMYISTPTGVYGTPVPPAELSNAALDSTAIYDALGRAIGGFAQSQPMQNAAGEPVTTIAAKVDRGKVCNKVLPAFGELMSKSTAAGGGAAALPGFGGGSLSGICKIMLVGDPRVWFGIDNGALTDIAVKAQIAIPLAGTMAFDLQYHEYDQGKPQTVKKPVGAKMVPSLQAIAPTAATAR